MPLDLIETGALGRFGYLDPTHGGAVKMGTVSAWYSRASHDGANFRVDGFVSRSLFDLFTNFTYFRDNSETGDAFQQHDSRLQEGVNAHYSRPQRLFGVSAMLTGGANFHDNQINVGLYPRQGRVPTGVTARANAHVTNGAGYFQESVSLWNGRLLAGGGLRYDHFRFHLDGRHVLAWQQALDIQCQL